MFLQSVLDAGFKKYGRVIADIDTSEIVKLMDSYNMPEDVVVENVHLSESLMRLSYNIANKNGKTRNIQEG